jgi:hypothetical protein
MVPPRPLLTAWWAVTGSNRRPPACKFGPEAPRYFPGLPIPCNCTGPGRSVRLRVPPLRCRAQTPALAPRPYLLSSAAPSVSVSGLYSGWASAEYGSNPSSIRSTHAAQSSAIAGSAGLPSSASPRFKLPRRPATSSAWRPVRSQYLCRKRNIASYACCSVSDIAPHPSPPPPFRNRSGSAIPTFREPRARKWRHHRLGPTQPHRSPPPPFPKRSDYGPAEGARADPARHL